MSNLRILRLVSFVGALVCALIALPSLPAAALAQQGIAQFTSGMEQRDGFFPLYWDGAEGRLYLEIPRLGDEFLYLTSLATGVGSNELGLDRGEIGDEYIARFERVGPKALLVLQNPRFRAVTRHTPALERSVEESFPTSTVGAFEILAEEQGRLLVDATSFFLRDVMDVARQLEADDQGDYRVDSARSTIFLENTKAFPENTEIEASLTFAADEPGWEVRRHTPDARALTLRQHHSFVQLPDDGYEPRAFDPRIGVYATSFYDYGKSFDEGYVTRYAARHRLVKRNPEAAMSEPIEPIIYYLDAAVPEPYRTAFKVGGAWWNDVFEAAGFIDAFRIEDMPPEMDAMDARYNVIQWVHRTEAGSSIGPSFRDPRTGEIIKAAVRMDSHRSLVDYNLYAGAVGTAGDWIGGLDPGVSAEEFVMARRRQHSAHEIGHTLGLAHNFIAISYGRASVMDYPAPLIELEGGRIDLSDAYRTGPGAYDTIAIRYAYTQFPAGQEEAGLDAIVREAMAKGLKFITNPDAASSNSYPEASTWTNNSDVLDELERVMEVRRVLIDRFGEEAIRPGEAMWTLNERFVPVYLHHRFTLDAAIKVIGGMEYRYALRGDPVRPMTLIPADDQRRAMDLLLAALEPDELAVPEDVLQLLAPRPFGHEPDPRVFESRAAPAFDQIGIARTLASMIVGGILEPERTARVVAFAARDPELPSFTAIVGQLVDGTWGQPVPAGHAVLHRVVQRVVLDELIGLAANGEATVESRAAAAWGLRRIAERLQAAEPTAPEVRAHRELAAADIGRFLGRGYEVREPSEPLPPPSGTPIGDPGH